MASSAQVLEFQEVVPDTMMHRPTVTGAGFVARKVKREFPPTAQTDFSPTLNSEMEFFISSDRDMLVPNEMYLRFELATIGTTGGSNALGREFEEGGANNLFRRVEITDTSGRMLDLIDGYDRLSNIMSNLFHSEDHIRLNEAASGDGNIEDLNLCNVGTADFTAGALANFVASDGGTNDLARFFSVGDTVSLLNSSANNNLIGQNEKPLMGVELLTIAGASATYSPQLGAAASITTPITAARSNRNIATGPANLSLTTVTESRVLTVRLTTGLFNINEDLPLFLMDGIRIKFFLNDPFKAIKLRQADAANVTGYIIRVPRIVASLRTPSEEMRQRYFDMFNSTGISYVFPAHERSSKQISGDTASSAQVDIAISKSSIRRVVFVIQNEKSRQAVASADPLEDSYVYPTNTFDDANIINFQFVVGGQQYPNVRVDVSGDTMYEGLTELLKTYNLHNNLNSRMRLTPFKYGRFNQNSSTGQCDASSKAIFATSFATLENDVMSGLRTKGKGTDNHIICQLEFDGVYERKVGGSVVSTNRYLEFYFEYARTIRLAKDGISVFD